MERVGRVLKEGRRGCGGQLSRCQECNDTVLCQWSCGKNNLEQATKTHFWPRGWDRWRACQGMHVTIGESSVRLGSDLQHDHVRQRKAEAHRLSVAEAVGWAPNSPRVPPGAAERIVTGPASAVTLTVHEYNQPERHQHPSRKHSTCAAQASKHHHNGKQSVNGRHLALVSCLL
jgi:hypothetical protein